MAFTQGNNLGRGRKQGSINKTTLSIKENYQKLIENNIDLLDADLKALSPRDRIKALIELSKFIIPTLKQVDAEVNTTTDISWLNDYTEEELYKILNS
jgi:hypothetical protein